MDTGAIEASVVTSTITDITNDPPSPAPETVVEPETVNVSEEPVIEHQWTEPGTIDVPMTSTDMDQWLAECKAKLKRVRSEDGVARVQVECIDACPDEEMGRLALNQLVGARLDEIKGGKQPGELFA